MITEIDHDEISLEPFGTRCEVPEHPVAKVMFYLRCIASLGYDLPSRFTNFERFRRLSRSDVDDVVTFANRLDPEILTSERVVIVNNKLAMGELSNRLYKLRGVSARGRSTRDRDSGTVRIAESKFLAVGTGFLDHFYYEPLREIRYLFDDSSDDDSSDDGLLARFVIWF